MFKQATINNWEWSSVKFLLILWPSLIWFTMHFQSLKHLPNLDRFVHSSIHSTNFIESLSSARHFRLERMNYSLARFCVKTLPTYILNEFFKFLPLNISWWFSYWLTWHPMNSLKFLHFPLFFKIYGDCFSVCLQKIKMTTCLSTWTFWEIQN